MIKNIYLIALLAAMLLPLRAFADEGMWPLPMLRAQDEARMQKLGLAIPLSDIYGGGQSLSRAVLSFGSGGTASFISSSSRLKSPFSSPR